MYINVSRSTRTRSHMWVVAGVLSVLLVFAECSYADKGGWHLHTEAVTLKESGQRAIIGWDGRTEVLCLGTDVSSSRKAIVIEFLPLPSQPKVVLGNRGSFQAVEKVLARRGVRFYKKKVRSAKGDLGGTDGGEAFRITFHQRLGAHDVTVVKVNRPDEFVDWIQEKAKALAGSQTSLPEGIRKLIAKYLNEYRCPYFVFDVIEVTPDPRSIQPIIYEFESLLLFYPLEISSTFHGQTSINLIVFSADQINPDPLWKLNFQTSSSSWVDGADMQEVLPRLKELLGERALVQAFRYSGNIHRLRGNIAAGWRRDSLVHTSGEYRKAEFRSFYLGVTAAILGGVAIAFVSLGPMYLASKRQKPRWGLRLLAGFLLGMPLGFGLIFCVANILIGLSELFEWTYYYSAGPVTLIACSMGMGFIIFCFQLGLRQRWPLWGLMYAALAIPATFVTKPNEIEKLFNSAHWNNVFDGLETILAGHILVFILLFISGKIAISISSLWRKNHSSKPRGELRLLAGFLLGMPLGLGLILGVAYVLGELHGWGYLSRITDPLIPIACSMGMGFIIFCFQVGLRRRWYLWGLMYAVLAVPATFISDPNRVEDLLEATLRDRLWHKIGYVFIAYLLVFVLLFLAARIIIWITSLWGKERSSLSEQNNR